jgi:lipoprotein-releasing system permease protein
MQLIGWLAMRGLVARRLSLALLVFAVAVGVGFQIPNTANLSGSTATLLEEFLTRGAADVRVEPRNAPRFADGAAIAKRIAQVVDGPRNELVIVLPGGIAASGSRFIGAPVVGVDFGTAPLRLSGGMRPAPGELSGLLGATLAQQVGARVGQSIELRVALGDDLVDESEGGAYTMLVRGIVSNTPLLESIFVDRAFLANELASPGAASSVLVHLADHATAFDAARAIEAALPDVRAVPWQTDEPFLPRVVRANAIIDRISLVMVIGAISVPLLALLYVHALRQRRDNAILRAIGFTRSDVFGIHLVQAFGVGAAGSATGALIGGVAIAVFERHPILAWETFVVRPLATAATFGIPIAAALATALLAGTATAWLAARREPAEVLKQLD